MFKLPFGTLPGHWGLKGRTREIAQAEYELTGYDLEKKLLELRKEDLEPNDYLRKMWDIELHYKLIGQSEYHRSLLTLISDDKQRALAELELDFREGKIKEMEYDKKTATIKGEPWVNVLNMDVVNKNSLEGSFEMDWNDLFVEKLKSEGYLGLTDETVVNQWFMELCRNVALEEFDGTGNFTSDSEANLDAMKRWSAPESFPQGRKGYK